MDRIGERWIGDGRIGKGVSGEDLEGGGLGESSKKMDGCTSKRTLAMKRSCDRLTYVSAPYLTKYNASQVQYMLFGFIVMKM